jgi:hypothetical protein
MFTGCSSRGKELELSKNVKQQLIDEENASIKLEKLKELDFGNENYYPVCWKDDENVIATSSSDNNGKHVLDIMTPTEADISIYDINVKTSQRSKLKTIEKAYCGDLGRKEFYGKFLYMKDNSLCMYNAIDNSEKVIYDLSEVIKEFKEPGFGTASNEQTMKDSDILPKIKAGFVKGSDKYVYIMSFFPDGWGDSQTLRMLDLSNGKVYKNSTLKGLFNSNEQFTVSWLYSKISDSFYACSMYNGRLYEYSLNREQQISNLKGIKGALTDISEDGNELLLVKANYGSRLKNPTTIEKYNIKSKKLTQLIYDKTKSSDSNKISGYSGILFNSGSIVNYSIQNITVNTKSKKITEVEDIAYLGTYDGVKIKSAKALPLEKIDNKGNINSIIFNNKGDKFIYSVCYYGQGEDLLTPYKTKSWVYQVK